MQVINSDSNSTLVFAFVGVLLPGIWLAYKLNLLKFFRFIKDEKGVAIPSFLFLFCPFLFSFLFSHLLHGTKNDMLSQSPGFYVICAALIALVSSLLTTLVNYKLQLEREKQQAFLQQESEKQKWYREKVYQAYKDSIQILTKVIQKKNLTDQGIAVKHQDFIELENLGWEFCSIFTIAIAGHPDKDSEEFKQKTEKILQSHQKNPVLSQYIVTQLMEHDSRMTGSTVVQSR